MKQRIFPILLALIMVFALAGCGEDKPLTIRDWPLTVNSLGELVQAVRDASPEDDSLDLKNLGACIPAYIGDWCEVRKINVAAGRIVFYYDLTESGQVDFLLNMSRSRAYAEEGLAYFLDPASYSNGSAPQPLEEVYYKDLYDDPNAKNPVTQFHFLHDGYLCFMKISNELLDQIKEKDPEALKGKLFELKRINLA
jgi:hypothetical protein